MHILAKIKEKRSCTIYMLTIYGVLMVFRCKYK